MRAIAKGNIVKSEWKPPKEALEQSRKAGIDPHIFEVVEPSAPRNSEWNLKLRMLPDHFIQINNFLVYSKQMFEVYMHIPEQMAYVIIKTLKDMRRNPKIDIKHISLEWTDGSKDFISISSGCVAYEMTNDAAPFGYWVWFDRK
jgi:hypothetical protein